MDRRTRVCISKSQDGVKTRANLKDKAPCACPKCSENGVADGALNEGMVMGKKIAVVIGNPGLEYARLFLKDCLESLSGLNYPRDDYRVYIVDLKSTDESSNFIQTMAPWVVLLQTGRDGWGHGNNVGAKRAMEDGYDDYFCFWNQDIVVHPDCLAEILKAFDSDPAIGIVQPKLLLYPANEEEKKAPLINSIGNVIHFLGFAYSGGYKLPSSAVGDEVRDVPYASGAGMVVRKETYLAVGGCDEDWFMYHDDLEICYKARLLEYRIAIAPKASMFHKYEFGRNKHKFYYMERNRFLFILQFFECSTLFLILPAFIVMELGVLYYAFRNGWLSAKWKAYSYFLDPGNRNALYSKRKIWQKRRKVRDLQTMRDFSSKIQFHDLRSPILEYLVNPALTIYWQGIKKILG